MKKISMYLLCFLLLLSCPLIVSAQDKTYERFKVGYISINKPFSDSGSQSCTGVVNFGYKGDYTFQVPASDVPAGSYFVLESSEGSNLFCSFFWSVCDFTSSTYWPSSNGRKDFTIWADEYKLLSTAGNLNNLYAYGDSVTFDPVDYQSSGYYYITGSVDVVNPPVLHLVTPSQPPEPGPEPGLPGDIGNASEELGDFGKDDGTQNDIFGAFKRLYDSLVGIASDDTVPDNYEPNLTVPDTYSIASSDSAFGKVSVYSAPVADYDTTQFKVIAGNLGASLGQDTGGESALYNLSPYLVQSTDSTQFPGDVNKQGHFFALHYRLEIPYRFYFGNHKGTAQAITDVSFDFDFDFTNVSPDNWDVQYGYPNVSVLPASSPVDILSTLKPESSGTSGDINDVINGQVRIKNLSVPVIDYASTDGYRLVIDIPLYIYDNSPFVDPNMSSYLLDVTLSNMTFNQCAFEHLSDSTVGGILGDIHEEQKNQNTIENDRYQDEQDKTQEAVDSVTGGLGDVTDTLSSWEIITMPIKIMKDFLTAITSDGSTVFTFPSFSVSGYTLWPSYSFDLSAIMKRFPLLFNTLHIISGILIVIWFIRYLWRKWAVITGDDLPDEEV